MSSMPLLRAGPFPRGRLSRHLAAAGVVACATLLRLAFDPLLHDQVPYFVYVGGVVVATWFCGVEAALVLVVLSALVGNFLFVPPRRTLTFDAVALQAMVTFAAFSCFLVWLVGRWRRAERIARRLHAEQTDIAERYRRLFENMNEMMAVDELLYDEHGRPHDWRILDVNPAYLQLTGKTRGELVGRRLSDVYGQPAPTALAERFASVVQAGRAVQFEEFFPPLQMHMLVSAFPLGGNRFGTLVTDVSTRHRLESELRRRMGDLEEHVRQLKQMEMALQEQAQELGRANRMKDEFLGTLSHELRTPLNAILGWSDMLRRGRLQGDQARRATESIHRNAKSLNDMINDVLDVSRIISGKVRIDVQATDPAALLQNAIDAVRAAADAKNVAIVTDFGQASVQVSGDATRLQQIFWNLLSNAIKFTPSGGAVRVSLRFVDDRLRVQVADTGIGIPADFLPHVFERFRQRDSSISRTHGGLGLGLAIVRHLVELHGGTVIAESAGEGQGSTFTVDLPVQRPERRQEQPAVRAATERPAGELPLLAGVRVLLVDDDDDARDVVTSLLEDHGAIAIGAADAEQALQRFHLFSPTVMLIDLGMPDVDGYALIDRIRRSDSQRSMVPAIALTAYAGEQDRQRALASGFQMHIAKPADAEALVHAVGRMASLARQPSSRV